MKKQQKKQQNYLTVYSDGHAFFKTTIELALKSGQQCFKYEDIPASMIRESVIVKPQDSNVFIEEQLYENEVSNISKLFSKAKGKIITLITEEGRYSGTYILRTQNDYVLEDSLTKEIVIISSKIIKGFILPEITNTLQAKPSLIWQIYAKKSGKYTADISYLLKNIRWSVTYNAVLKEDDLEFQSWVTLKNDTNKDYNDVKLKLIAGDAESRLYLSNNSSIRLCSERHYLKQISHDEYTPSYSPSFEGKPLSDYKLYTFTKSFDIGRLQEKQLALHPICNVKYTKQYEYQIHGDKVKVYIIFKNDKQSGLGIPLPEGVIAFYSIDNADDTKQYIGSNTINHTPVDEKVALEIGSPFDIIAKTEKIDFSKNERFNTSVYKVTLTNRTTEPVKVLAYNLTNKDVEMTQSEIDFSKVKAHTFEAWVELKPDETKSFTLTEKEWIKSEVDY